MCERERVERGGKGLPWKRNEGYGGEGCNMLRRPKQLK